MEVETNDTLPFLDILLMKRDPKLGTKVYWKPTHTAFEVQPPTSGTKASQ
jgi:hypothetical protein